MCGRAERCLFDSVLRALNQVSSYFFCPLSLIDEPVWAIGTGLVCGANEANKMHKFIRERLSEMYDDEVAQATRIQYGGSVTPESVDGLMSMPEIDGCLVGGASLDSEKFARICNFQKLE